MNTTILGLDKNQTENLVNELNTLLANFQTYSQSLKAQFLNDSIGFVNNSFEFV